jgi:hypothetical protein
MWQHRWWLKLFFYLLDLCTSNALLLFNEVKKNSTSIEFKRLLVQSLVGAKIEEVARMPINIHKAVRMNRVATCVPIVPCCPKSLKPDTSVLPLCTAATGVSRMDCFALAHNNENMRKACMQKYESIQKHTNM